MFPEPSEAVCASAATFGVKLEGALASALGNYLERLLEVNRSMNLTAITEPDQAWTKHALDSLSLLPRLAEVRPAEHVVDIGSGGGLPAIPLALAAPHLSFTLVESTRKKAAFLADTVRALGLENVTILAERAEVVGHGPLRESCAVATARAVSRLPVLLELTLPLLRMGGRLLAIKGAQASLEIEEAAKAINLLGGALLDSTKTETGTIVCIAKVGPTPARYPRRPGEPNRAPLG